MRLFKRLVNDSVSRSTALFMRSVCYAAMLLCAVCLVLSLIGRQQFTLHTSTEMFNNAIYAEEDHRPASRRMTVHMKDDVHVFAAVNNDKIDLKTQVGLSAMYVVHLVPLIICFWFLSRVFNNISKGQIFTDKNASYVLYYGLIQTIVAVIAPFAKQFICYLTNQFAVSQISISTSSGILNDVLPNIAYLVAAYIIHYGVHLQDEVDHTL